LDPVPTIPRSLAGVSLGISQSIVPTNTFANPPGNLEVLLVPGGFGTHEPEDSAAAVAFVKDIYPKLKYIISVCTGSIILARAGVLEGKKATTNKAMWEQATATSNGANIKWVPAARWVVDGNVYTTSGVAAGMDGTFAFIAKIWGEEVATSIANIIEYERHTDPHWDPFAAIHGVSGA
jgi:transcriptional regulator GlxA family with amidase domain